MVNARGALPPVFISYRHEDDVHCARVRDFATRLEGAGVSVVLDQFAQERMFRGGGPDEGWPRWSKAQAGVLTHKVLIIASPGWFRCYEMKEAPGSGLGATAEAGVIEQRLYNAGGASADIRIVTFGRADPLALPLDLQRYHRFADPAGFSELVNWLTGAATVAASTVAVANWPETPPPLLWPVADFNPVRAALEQLLTRRAQWRFLPLRGPSEAGKSHVTRQIIGNALRVPGLACGRFDFKGTTAVNLELRAFIQNLGVPLPEGGSLSERFGRVLDAVNQQALPTLFVFDTYEAADDDAQNWVEKQLLPTLIRATWLRVVIAGQTVPECAGALWSREAFQPITLTPPPPEEWLTFGQLHKRDLTIEFVRQVHQYCSGRASVLAQVLGPAV